MRRIIFMLLLLLLSAPVLFCSRRRSVLRVMYGRQDKIGQYPFVVALVSKYFRQCTGTLISPEWVLTAAHCIQCDDCFTTHIQYGNMGLLPNSSRMKSEILQKFRHPGYRDYDLLHDIALVRVEPVSMAQYGKISAVDYNSLIGHTVIYAGYGTTENDTDNDGDRRPLIIGEGVVRSCHDLYTEDITPAPYLCVAPRCSNKNGDSAPGDSGGPLFYDGKIVGVVSTGLEPIGFYASLSPYITWISEVLAKTQNNNDLT